MTGPKSSHRISRRRFLSSSAVAVGGLAAGARFGRGAWAQGTAPAVITPDRLRPAVPLGVQSGDITGDRAVVWSQTDRPARMVVEYATTESFRDLHRVIGPAALPESDFTAR